MEKFNYGRALYDEKIFDLENSNDAFKSAIKDSSNMEEYFLSKTPNIDAIRSLIINSYRLNKSKNLIGKKRLYYTIGIAYSMEYINFEDLNQFIQHVSSTTYVDDSSVFQRKGFADNIKGFFVDAFEEDLVELREVLSHTKNYKETEIIYLCDGCGKQVDENDKVCPFCGEDLSETVDDDEDSFINIKDLDEKMLEEDYEDLDENLINSYVDVTATQKIKLFKDNFDEFVNHQLERKNVEGVTKTKYIINGMRDWFNYCIYFFDEFLNIENNMVMTLTNNIGKYL